MPRAEIRDIIRRIAMTAVPHLPRTSQINFIASTISRECDRSIAPGLVRDLWYALDDDERGVDSRHMDWARARARSISANDNRIMSGTRSGDPRDCSPGSSEALIQAVAA